MRKLILMFCCFSLFFGATWTSSAQKQPNNLAKLMAEKLNNSKMLLEGIALEDYNKISRSADSLIQLSKSADWFVYKTPRYELHCNEFRRAAENIQQKAKDKNLDGVTLAYFELTMACVRCHKYVREVRDARIPLPMERGLVLVGE
jgi:hypothetical protein